MRIVVTGGTGQLGKAFASLAHLYTGQMFILGSRDMDVTIERQVIDVFNQILPDVVIHAGAYTAVDAAETAQDEAFRLICLVPVTLLLLV
ncbi:sugar nucleotide-binding protein [Sporomusa sp.]|uniref:sugar nucleotide-binding protein n=1 Tax=Sporomusa sp. TaxID=2078658 RepID=UPI002C86406C|nr:sugar nucleotide-binding protein [Sporomusa sp.]HWR06291.1 sugar nucleotide-binding protein [Sporomusa sp.]HWR41840.1 sugar nucleotide-binding protein [Sporomusa sp.]